MRNEREDSGAKANPDVEAVTSRTAPTHESHSPLPWTVNSVLPLVQDADGLIANCLTSPQGDIERIRDEANARFIVRCVNSHDALIAALQGLVDLLNEDLDPEQAAAWDVAVAVLAKAEATQ